MEELIAKYSYPMKHKLKNFEKYVSRVALARHWMRYELYKKIKGTKGSIVECGVHWGGGHNGLCQTICWSRCFFF